MNERLRELVEQATSIVEVKHEGYRGKGYTTQDEFFDREKFTELIVEECADIAKHHVMNISTYSDAEFVGERIREHFGVESRK